MQDRQRKAMFARLGAGSRTPTSSAIVPYDAQKVAAENTRQNKANEFVGIDGQGNQQYYWKRLPKSEPRPDGYDYDVGGKYAMVSQRVGAHPNHKYAVRIYGVSQILGIGRTKGKALSDAYDSVIRLRQAQERKAMQGI